MVQPGISSRIRQAFCAALEKVAGRSTRGSLRPARLVLVLAAWAVWAIPSARPDYNPVWLERGWRPPLYNRGLPLSDAFRQYLESHFSPDPRKLQPRPSLPIVKGTHPKNLILMIGDGMGLAHSDAAAMAAYGIGGRLAMHRMTIVGLMATQSASSILTDSGAASTAMATGFRTYNGSIAVGIDGRHLESFFMAAKRRGKRVGLVVTSSVTDATPAAFFTNVRSRFQDAEIAVQLVERGVNVIFGGGFAYFLPRSHPSGLSMRYDNRDVLVEAVRRGYRVTLSSDELTTLAGEQVMGIFGAFAMPSACLPYRQAGWPQENWPHPSLREMTGKALELLSQGPDGFCLLVEGSQIDWQAHANDFEGVLWETLEFDRAVARCLEFAEKDGETLVLVTADHETGGLGLSTRDRTGLSAYWTSAAHTAIRVPLFAYGPGCLQFAGVYDNVDVAIKCATLLGLDDFPALGR